MNDGFAEKFRPTPLPRVMRPIPNSDAGTVTRRSPPASRPLAARAKSVDTGTHRLRHRPAVRDMCDNGRFDRGRRGTSTLPKGRSIVARRVMLQVQNITPAVMPGRVQFEMGTRHLLNIDIGVKGHLFGCHGPRDQRTARGRDH